MNARIGAKGGKKDRKLTFLNRRRKIQLKHQQRIQEQEKEKEHIEKKQEEEIILSLNKSKDIEKEHNPSIEIDAKEKKVFEQQAQKDVLCLQKEKDISQQPLDNTPLYLEKKVQDNPKPTVLKQIQKQDSKYVINTPTHKKNDKLSLIKDTKEKEETIFTKHSKGKGKAKEQNANVKESWSPVYQEKRQKRNHKDAQEFLEKQIVKVLEQDIQEKKYQLKKLDSEIHTLQKNIDSATDKEELIELEKEIQKLIDMVEYIKKQIISLEKTFYFDFPVEEPDNYLIYLIEEYKTQCKEELTLDQHLHQNQKFHSLMDTMVEIEEKQEDIQNRLQEKRKQMELEEEQIEKLGNEVLDVEEIHQKLAQMLEKQEKIVAEITYKVNESVHITEKTETITKHVEHTMLELFLLMELLKHNLSIKNNAVAAVTAALALDMIIKMTTPIQEKVIVYDNDFKNYERLIKNCIDDTTFLEQTIHNNLDKIGSIRYTFEKDYQACSYLPSYQNALEKLTSLEDDMKERKEDIARMKKDIALQLEKNNTKVKQYGVGKAA